MMEQNTYEKKTSDEIEDDNDQFTIKSSTQLQIFYIKKT